MIGDGFKIDSGGQYIEKLAGSRLDYGFLFAAWLQGDTIASSTWSLPGLTEVSNSHDDTTTAVVISGGTAGSAYVVTNTVQTAAGLIDSRSFRILCI